MYSGSTLTNMSGNVIGAHQKVDRISRRALKSLLTHDVKFPSTRLLLHFEGKNGPDSAKAKLDGENAPWHFYDPFDPDDGHLLEQMDAHYKSLVCELRANNLERAAFEASWLAHAILDGLTPAHHYPFEAELERLRGEGKETRTTVLKKVVIPGVTKRDFVIKNWEMWGAKGLFTTHALFEWGAATIMAPMSGKIAHPSRYDIKTAQKLGLEEYFKRIAREVALLDMYEQFYKRGWTPNLANVLRKELAPRMAQTVTIAWYMAARDAGIATGEV
jgi:hypothetical protein